MSEEKENTGQKAAPTSATAVSAGEATAPAAEGEAAKKPGLVARLAKTPQGREALRKGGVLRR